MNEMRAGKRTSPRERYRTQIRDEIKEVALRQLAELGAGGVSINAIGKELGVTGPALYRYFPSRDELLKDLVIDGYNDMGAAIGMAAAKAPDRPARSRLEAVARAYREWAVTYPHRYRLLYVAQFPGHDPNAEELVGASQAPMQVVLDALPPADGTKQPPKALSAQATAWMKNQGLASDAANAVRAVQAWSRVHGFVSLEIAGAFASMGLDPDALFDLELTGLGR